MSDQFVQVAPDSTGKKVDTSELVVGVNTVERQRIVLGDDASATALANIIASAPAGTEFGLVVRNIPFGTQTVSLNNTTTKGTQGASPVPTLDLKDAGRNNTNFFMNVPVVTTATDALVSLTGYKSEAAVAATTTPAVVSAGKTYRIASISVTYVAIATAGTVKFTLRANAAGVAAVTSPAVLVAVVGGPAAVAGVSQTYDIPIPEGLEFAAGTGIGVSMVGLSTTQVAAAVGYGQITLIGYEY